MKEIKKITIKEFCKQYTDRVPQMRENYLKENLVITPYIPFIEKNSLADRLVDISTYQYEDYTKEDGTIGRRKTDRIHINSTVQYLLFCRLVIENYTNLIVETDGFFEEYDLLKSSGLLDRLMINTETTLSLIPMDEITELRAILDMKQKDILFNTTEIHNYINSLVERFSDVINVLSKPIMDKVVEQLENNIDENTSVENNFLEVNK